jgi:hypothetical protein
MKSFRSQQPPGTLAALAFCLSMVLPRLASADPLTAGQVRAAVVTWLQLTTTEPRPHAVVELMEPYSADGHLTAYIVHLRGGGFCFAGADDWLVPVCLYCPRGTYDPAFPVFQRILADIHRGYTKLRTARERQDSLLLWIVYGYNQQENPWMFHMNIGWGFNVYSTFYHDFPGEGMIDLPIAPLGKVRRRRGRLG